MSSERIEQGFQLISNQMLDWRRAMEVRHSDLLARKTVGLLQQTEKEVFIEAINELLVCNDKFMDKIQSMKESILAVEKALIEDAELLI